MSLDSTPGITKLIKKIQEAGNTLVALSGGVDSAVLLALAARALGPGRVLAATAVSPAVPVRERGAARLVARHLGVSHQEVPTRELENSRYLANAGDRCLHCRTEMFERLAALGRARGYPTLAYGAIVDDLGEHRPGMAAARRLGVRAPLLEAGWGKAEVRDLARRLELPVSEKPSEACLSSRIPVGTPVTPERLARVERAEAALIELGFGQLRVRHHGEVARLELDSGGSARLADPELRRRVVDAVRAAGFRFVALDLDGYRPGSVARRSD